MRLRNIIALCFALSVWLVQTPLALAQKASRFDLSSWHASQSEPAPLSGQWHFVWDELLTPEEATLAFAAQSTEVVAVPANWTAYQPKSDDNPYGHGHATFFVRVTLPETAAPEQMLHVQMIQNSYRLIWVPLDAPEQARVITESGAFLAPGTTSPRGVTYPFAAAGDGLLLIHVNKDTFTWGGVRAAPVVISAADATAQAVAKYVWLGFLFGALFYIGITNLMLHLTLRTDAAALLMVVVVSCLAVRSLAMTNVIEALFGLDWHVLRMRVEIASIPILASAGFAVNQALFPLPVPRVIAALVHGMTALLVAFLTLAPSEFVSMALPVVQVHVVGTMLLCLALLMFSLRQGTRHAKSLGIALLFTAMAAVHDVIAANTDGYSLSLAETALLVVMGFYSHIIGSRATRAISRAQVLEVEKEDLAQQHSDALHDARHDHLTDLLNRQSFDHHWYKSWEETRTSGQPLSVVLFDIDHFKSINDTHGHVVGDRALIALADRLRATPLRDGDHAFRYGGEEFVLILPGTGEAQAARTAERLRRIIADTPLLTEDPELSISCSFGVAGTDVSLIDDADTLLQWADDALYTAKHGGRNRVCQASQSPKSGDTAA